MEGLLYGYEESLALYNSMKGNFTDEQKRTLYENVRRKLQESGMPVKKLVQSDTENLTPKEYIKKTMNIIHSLETDNTENYAMLISLDTSFLEKSQAEAKIKKNKKKIRKCGLNLVIARDKFIHKIIIMISVLEGDILFGDKKLGNPKLLNPHPGMIDLSYLETNPPQETSELFPVQREQTINEMNANQKRIDKLSKRLATIRELFNANEIYCEYVDQYLIDREQPLDKEYPMDIEEKYPKKSSKDEESSDDEKMFQ